MRTPTVKLVALLAVVPALVAFTTDTTRLELGPQSRLWIAGTSTVREFECKAAIVDAVIADNGPGTVEAVLSGRKAVRSVSLTVPAAKMDCGNGKMNEHMLKALKAEQFPTITFRLSDYDLVKATGGMKADLKGELTIGGVTKTVTIDAQGKDLPGGVLSVTGTHAIRMTEYGLKPPTLMMGALKVGDKVQVNFELVLTDAKPVVATLDR
jgi:hypothetical protein